MPNTLLIGLFLFAFSLFLFPHRLAADERILPQEYAHLKNLPASKDVPCREKASGVLYSCYSLTDMKAKKVYYIVHYQGRPIEIWEAVGIKRKKLVWSEQCLTPSDECI